MAETLKEVRGLSIPLQGIRLILPDSIVLQVLTGMNVISINDAPSWLLGQITWQKRVIPVLSFEVTANKQYSSPDSPIILVLKSVNNIEKMPFYAIVLAGIPHPLRVNEENLSVVENVTSTAPVIMNEVLVEGEPSSIPNIDALEEMLISQYGLFAESSDTEN